MYSGFRDEPQSKSQQVVVERGSHVQESHCAVGSVSGRNVLLALYYHGGKKRKENKQTDTGERRRRKRKKKERS